MSGKISVCVLNSFLDKNGKSLNFRGLNSYALVNEISNKHFMREWGTGKKLLSDDFLLNSILEKKETNKTFNSIFDHLRGDENSSLHIIVSVESCIHYLPIFLGNYSLVNSIYLHVVLEKEEDYNAIPNIESMIETYPFLVLASLSGKKSAFNESSNWNETQKFYDEICFIQMQTGLSLGAYLEKLRDDGVTLVDISPVSFINAEPLEDGDVLLVLDESSEKVSSIVKAFEVSKRDEKRKEFNNFNRIFITKSLPYLLLCCLEKPYAIYENEVLLENEDYPTLLGRFSEREIRVAQFGNKRNLRRINKDFNNEKAIVFDGHKKFRTECLISKSGVVVASESDMLLKKFSEEIGNFDMTMLGLDTDSQMVLDDYLQTVEDEGSDILIIDFQSNKVYSNLNLGKKMIASLDLYSFLYEYFNS